MYQAEPSSSSDDGRPDSRQEKKNTNYFAIPSARESNVATIPVAYESPIPVAQDQAPYEVSCISRRSSPIKSTAFRVVMSHAASGSSALWAVAGRFRSHWPHASLQQPLRGRKNRFCFTLHMDVPWRRLSSPNNVQLIAFDLYTVQSLVIISRGFM
jgi:hypothetical protein